MIINAAIRELWKTGFFLQHRKPREVKKKLFDEYQITCSNISQQLKSCKRFLRTEKKGWIQKANYSQEESKVASKNKKDSIENLLDNSELWSACRASFESTDYWDACLLALRHLETKIREKSELTAGEHGIDLVKIAFHPKNGILKIPSCAVYAEEEGFHLINRGIVLFHRNARGHREGITSRKNAVKIICYVDYLLEILKTAEKRD